MDLLIYHFPLRMSILLFYMECSLGMGGIKLELPILALILRALC